MRLVARLLAGVILIAFVTVAFALFHPRSPLPDAWHPMRALNVSGPVTPLTSYKLNRALADGALCLAVLSGGATYTTLPDLEDSESCFIRHRVDLQSVAGIELTPVETRCQTALRLALWAEHGIKPAAARHFGTTVDRLHHVSSYNCRRMRTAAGNSTRMSSHATAEAIDIAGVTLGDGSRLTLLDGWPDSGAKGRFFRDLRNTACTWFRVTLGPDFNRLHADHFHLQHSGWGTCR